MPYSARSKRSSSSPTGNSFAGDPDLSDSFDVLVVGGGAVGCAMTWEAASRGLRTALVERDDFGAATSANSMRIVHGGLRYLQSFSLARARRSSAERSTFLRIAPHLVTPLECVVPTSSSIMRSRATLGAALVLNAMLTIDRNRRLGRLQRLPAGGLISKSAFERRAPGVAMQGVTGGAGWFDAQMLRPERLALAFALSARDRGAVVANHVEVLKFLTEKGRVIGAVAENSISRSSFEIRARVVLDCRGAWFGRGPREACHAARSSGLRFVKAINLALREPKVLCGVGFPVRATDGAILPGRMLFALPAPEATLVGTWYFRCSGDPDAEHVRAIEIEQALADINSAFPGSLLSAADVTAVQLGFLPEASASTPTSGPTPTDRAFVLRAHTVGGPKALWHVQTEKWTTVRRLAETTLDRLIDVEGLQAKPSETAVIGLRGSGPVERLSTEVGSSVWQRLSTEQQQHLLATFGSESAAVLNYVEHDGTMTEPVPGAEHIAEAAIHYCLENEQARTLDDVMRRVGLGSLRRPAQQSAQFVAKLMAERFEWSAAETAAAVGALCSHSRYRPHD